MKKIVILFLSFFLSIVTIAQTNSSKNILVFNITGISNIIHLKNGEKTYTDIIPITDGREMIFDFDNNIIKFKHINSPFKIIKQFESQQVTLLDSEIFEVIDKNNESATFQLALANDMALLYYRKKKTPGRIDVFYLAYK